jgi:hypothetical protein
MPWNPGGSINQGKYLGRLAYDITHIHGSQENRLSGWLEQIADIPAVPMEALLPLLLEPSAQRGPDHHARAHRDRTGKTGYRQALQLA